MPRKTFVYPHPINAYIIKQLGITVEEFCELHAFSQGTVSSWITRNKKIETLPISFIYWGTWNIETKMHGRIKI